MSSNLLERLPDAFGNLQGLTKLWFENNKLTQLPPSIGDCRAHTANFSLNALERLPDTIGSMVSLTNLSINLNKLTELPESLCRLPCLHTLHASQNLLLRVPHNIGELQSLRDLRLDWNRIEELPFSFRLLSQLGNLRMERNPLKLPPMEYVVKGIPATLAYIDRRLEEFRRKSRREIIERLQEVLAFAMKFMLEELEMTGNTSSLQQNEADSKRGGDDSEREEDRTTITSYFEPNCMRVDPTGIERLPYYAVVWEEFYTLLLPAIERRKATSDPERPSFQLDAFSPEDVEDALLKYDDDFGAASMIDFNTEFRKCACIDTVQWKLHGVRKRKVCLPGIVPYRCKREARMIRMQMMTHEEAKDQLANSYLQKKVARLVHKTKRKCVEYINSEAGLEHFERLAHELAKKLHQKRKRLRKLDSKHEKATKAFAKRRRLLEAKIAAFEKAKVSRLSVMNAKLEKLHSDQAKLDADGPVTAKLKARREKIDQKIAKLEQKLEQESVEDSKILETELALAALESAEKKATIAAEKAKAKETVKIGDKDDLDDAQESEDEGGETEAADGTDDEEDEEDEDEEEEEEDKEDNDTEEGPNTTSSDGKKSYFQVEMPEMTFVDYRRAATIAIERRLDEARAKKEQDAQAVGKNFKYEDANEEELVMFYQSQLRDEYVEEKCARVAKKATFEFLQMRAVLQRWMGLSNRAIFEAWHEVVKKNRLDAAQIKEKAVRRVLVAQQNKALEEELARLEACKWIQRTDMYTDAVYYEHSVTGETAWTPPAYWEEEQQIVMIPHLKLPPI